MKTLRDHIKLDKTTRNFIQQQICDMLYMTEIPGMDNLIHYLKSKGFFEAPCSIGHHLNVTGGLAYHSWSVCELALTLKKLYDLPLTDNEVIVAALLHDVQKIFDYVRATPKGKWRYASDNQRHKHGTGSVEIVEQFIQLTENEREMITWHMGPYTMYYEGEMKFCEGDSFVCDGCGNELEKPKRHLAILTNLDFNFFKWSPKGDADPKKKLALFLYFCDHFSTIFLEG